MFYFNQLMRDLAQKDNGQKNWRHKRQKICQKTYTLTKLL